ncbi:MAG TPA: alpha/beta fold hydrolase, partial [Thermomicrobiales bacterium]|nr:alpha/beta fold hydrolase [Thermomicrobiales bacterium]
MLSTTALVVVLGAQSAPETASSSTFTIYLRSAPIGSETISVARTPDGWTISSSGRTGLPIDLATRQLQLHYTPDWKPIDLSIDATIRGVQLSGRTTVSGTTAQSSFLQNGETVNRTDTIAPDAVLLINPLWAPFEALARRVRNAPPGTTVPGHVLGTAFSIEVGPSKDETLQMGTQTFSARRTAVTLPSGGAMLQAEIWSDDAGRLLRVSIPAQNLEVVREDIASVAVRVVKVSRPNDEDIRIPANGFRLAATLSKPMNAAPKDKLPLVVLVGGSGPTDRDETVYGIPIFGQLAGALADAGFMVVRYDKRAVGQSGGRAESATLNDYADDLIAVLTAVGKRDDVDDDRVAVLGHSEGGSVAMIAASREGDIKALALVATMGTTGAELNMWQVMHAMERSKQPPEETATTIELQRRIQEAVITGKGWDRIPA